jgi:hypothetical protein
MWSLPPPSLAAKVVQQQFLRSDPHRFDLSCDRPYECRHLTCDSGGEGPQIMPDEESPAERYRRLAHQCLEIARTMTNQNTRIALMEMADPLRGPPADLEAIWFGA